MTSESFDNKILKGIDAVADLLGKSSRQIRRYIAEGLPRLGEDTFHSDQVRAWYDSRKNIRAPRQPVTRWVDPKQLTFTDQSGSGKEFHEERLKRHRADLAEMEVRQRRAQLVERKELEHLWISRIMAVKQGLLTFARALPPKLIHCSSEREMEVIILSAVRELLDGFSRPLPEAMGGLAVDPEGGEE